MEKNRVLTHSLTHSINQSLIIFDAPETEAFASQKIAVLELVDFVKIRSVLALFWGYTKIFLF